MRQLLAAPGLFPKVMCSLAKLCAVFSQHFGTFWKPRAAVPLEIRVARPVEHRLAGTAEMVKDRADKRTKMGQVGWVGDHKCRWAAKYLHFDHLTRRGGTTM